jgi:hypothetical protein
MQSIHGDRDEKCTVVKLMQVKTFQNKGVKIAFRTAHERESLTAKCNRLYCLLGRIHTRPNSRIQLSVSVSTQPTALQKVFSYSENAAIKQDCINDLPLSMSSMISSFSPRSSFI